MDRKILIDLLDDFAFGSHDIEQTADRINELYKRDQALQLQQTGVIGSYSEKDMDNAYDKGFKDAMLKYRTDL